MEARRGILQGREEKKEIYITEKVFYFHRKSIFLNKTTLSIYRR